MMCVLYFCLSFHNQQLEYSDKWFVEEWSEWPGKMLVSALINMSLNMVCRVYNLHIMRKTIDSPLSKATRRVVLCEEYKYKLDRDAKICIFTALNAAAVWCFCNGERALGPVIEWLVLAVCLAFNISNQASSAQKNRTRYLILFPLAIAGVPW